MVKKNGGGCFSALDNASNIACDPAVIVTINKQTNKQQTRRFLTLSTKELVVTDKIYSDI